MTISLNLSKKVPVTAFVLFCAGFLPLIFIMTAKMEENLTRLLSNQQSASTAFVAKDIEQKLLLRIQSLQDVADNLPLDQINDPSAVSDYLAKRIAIYRLYSGGVFVIGLNGFGIADHPKLQGRSAADYRDFEYFKQVLSTGMAVIDRPRIGRFTHEMGLTIAVPIKNSRGQTLAVMAGVISFGDSSLFDHAQARLGKTGKYLIVSLRDGLVFIDPENMHGLKPLKEMFSEDVVRSLLAGKDNTEILQSISHEKEYLTSTKYILDRRWLVLGMIPVDEVFQPVSALRNELYVISVISLLCITALMWWLMHRYLSPLVTATRQLRQMVFGEVPLHELAVERNDEIGDLFQSFNKLQREVKLSHEALEAQARVDFLTGLFNRRYFMELAENELSRSERYQRPLSVFMIDIDHFKKVNDVYGHYTGDLVLKRLSNLMQGALRELDIIGRIGGEEFAVILPETGLENAVKIAERLREKISTGNVSLDDGSSLHFTVSIGVAALGARDINVDALLNFADEALYEAKRERNKVCVSRSALV